jgi:hypothetical protein
MKTRLFIIIVAFALIMTSCYYKDLQYSFDRSTGGVLVESSCFYLAQVREYRNPKGISRFPDGGQILEVRKIFGLFKTDTLSNTTEMAAELLKVNGWPSRYKSRLEKNGTDIIIGIANIHFPDSVNGIYLYNLNSGKLTRYSGEGVLPAISKTFTRLAYCYDTILYIEDYSDRSLVAKYHLDVDPVFVEWAGDSGILLFCYDPFRVLELDLNTGLINKSELEYIPNYGQEMNATEIRKIIERSSPDLKNLLDQKTKD